MHSTSLSAVAVLALALSLSASATPAATPPHIRPPSLPLVHNKRHLALRSSPDFEVRRQWLRDEADKLAARYGVGAIGLAGSRDGLEKRQSLVALTDVGYDASYSATVHIGTPSQAFEVFADTGSADLWVASNECLSTTCQGIPTFDPATSSTFKHLNQPFNITYGSGQADGTLGQDSVTMGAYTISNQVFGVVTEGSDNLLSAPVSGLIGLAWQRLASSGATPFWQQLAQSGKWEYPAFGVYLKRYRDDPTATDVETDGGQLDLGYLNNTIFTGDIHYTDISAADEDYWRIPVNGLQVGGRSVSISVRGGQAPEAAIDTGTTLIAIPTTAAAALYSKIQGSRPLGLTGYQGYFEYPCSQIIDVSLTFNGITYSITNGDFNLGQFTNNAQYCTGAVYGQDLGSSSPISWIVGATFLKNVYSVFRYNPPGIGFAALASSPNQVATATGSLASATGAAATAAVSGTGSGSTTSGAIASFSLGSAAGIISMLTLVATAAGFIQS